MRGKSIGPYLLVALCYVLWGLILLHPLILSGSARVAGYDFYHFHWNMWWVRHALTTPGLNVYETNYVLAPFTSNLSYHTLALFWYPLWAALESLSDTFTAVNLIILASCALNGWLCFALLRSEGVAPGVALIGGLLFQTLPTLRYFYYNSHLNLIAWFWLPVHLLLWKCVAACVSAERLRHAFVWSIVQGVALWAMALTDLQFPLFVGFLLVPYALLTLWKARTARRVIALLAAGFSSVVVSLFLMWFAGPLPYLMKFTGTLAPGDVRSRPGIPFPQGYLAMDEQWWEWDRPSLGGSVTLLGLAGLLIGLAGRRSGRAGAWVARWFWFALALPPLILSLGPTLRLGEVEFALPYRWLYEATSGLFWMPWRLAPVFALALLIFVGQILTPILAGRPRVKLVAIGGAMVFIAADLRLFEGGPTRSPPPPYRGYEAMGREPYDYVVIEVPTGAGSGEILVGDPSAAAFQYYGIVHGKRMVNGFIARAPLEHFWYLRTDDPMLSWLGQRRPLEPGAVAAQLRERMAGWPIGYIVVHQGFYGRASSINQEIIGYLNTLDGLLCPPIVERDAVFYRTRSHPAGCEPRTPPESAPGIYRIDIGSEGDEPFIGWGWHWPEQVFDLTLRWTGEYPQTRLYVDLPPGDYDFAIHAQAFWEARTLRIRVNGREVGAPATIGVETLQTYTFPLPAAIIGDGQRLAIVLEYDSWVVPAQVGQSADPRKLAIALDWLEFRRRRGGFE